MLKPIAETEGLHAQIDVFTDERPALQWLTAEHPPDIQVTLPPKTNG